MSIVVVVETPARTTKDVSKADARTYVERTSKNVKTSALIQVEMTNIVASAVGYAQHIRAVYLEYVQTAKKEQNGLAFQDVQKIETEESAREEHRPVIKGSGAPVRVRSYLQHKSLVMDWTTIAMAKSMKSNICLHGHAKTKIHVQTSNRSAYVVHGHVQVQERHLRYATEKTTTAMVKSMMEQHSNNPVYRHKECAKGPTKGVKMEHYKAAMFLNTKTKRTPVMDWITIAMDKSMNPYTATHAFQHTASVNLLQ